LLIEDILRKIDFSFYYFLNNFVAQKKAYRGSRSTSNSVYQKKNSKSIVLLETIPTLSKKSKANFDETELQKLFKIDNLDQRIRESQFFIFSKLKREEIKVPMIKPEFFRSDKMQNQDEELKELDDNDIIGYLTNFSGVLNLWYSLKFRER